VIQDSIGKIMSNNAINADGLVQRAFGALPKPAGYCERRRGRCARKNCLV
jgi:hypothetical protein